MLFFVLFCLRPDFTLFYTLASLDLGAIFILSAGTIGVSTVSDGVDRAPHTVAQRPVG